MINKVRLLDFSFQNVLIGGVGDIRVESRVARQMIDVLPHARREVVHNGDFVALR